MSEVQTRSPTQLDPDTATRMAELFSTMSDASRVRIIAALSAGEEMNVGELAARVDISHSAVSHHLRHLRQMRLVRVRKEGRYVYYALDDEHVHDLYRCGLEHVTHG
jgi:DNA-binding transcriptional ArsR family regulator